VDKETTTAKKTIRATTFMDKGTPTAIRAIDPKTTFKEMPPLPETLRTHAFNAEKWDTLPETAQSVTKATSTIERPT